MSMTITEAQVQQYGANIRMLFQQQGSKLRKYVMEKELNGKFRYFERLASTAAVVRATRHGDTPLVEQTHSRRRVDAVDYEWADLFDPQDDIRVLIDPIGAYTQNAVWALGRAVDDSIITAFNASSLEGETGATTTSFPAGQQIANGGTGFTVAKLRQAKRILDLADVPQTGRYVVIAPHALEDLLTDTAVTSSDFNVVKALVNGEVNTFMGFQFEMTTRLPKTGNIRSCFAWHESCMGLAIGNDITTRVSERADKSYSLQVYAKATFGSLRIEDEGVVQIDYDETA